MKADFWVASGHVLVDRAPNGGLGVSDDLLKAYLARPELLPPPEACPVERAVHARLLDQPRTPIAPEELALIADADARENFSHFLAYRDHLLAHPTLEAAYLALIETGKIAAIPPLFTEHLVHLIARNAFDVEEDAYILRAAECLWRDQRVTFHEGAVLLADAEAIEGHEHAREHSPLLSMLGGPAVSALDILNPENAHSYKGRSDAHDLVFDLTDKTHGRAAFGAAMARFLQHVTGIALHFTPVDTLESANIGWFLTFDAQSTALANRLWAGKTLSLEENARMLALYTFVVPNHPRIEHRYWHKKAFAMLSCDAARQMRVKPQNLIAGLPLAKPA